MILFAVSEATDVGTEVPIRKNEADAVWFMAISDCVSNLQIAVCFESPVYLELGCLAD